MTIAVERTYISPHQQIWPDHEPMRDGPFCPRHGTALIGGPAWFTCLEGLGHGVPAADIDHEFHGRDS